MSVHCTRLVDSPHVIVRPHAPKIALICVAAVGHFVHYPLAGTTGTNIIHVSHDFEVEGCPLLVIAADELRYYATKSVLETSSNFPGSRQRGVDAAGQPLNVRCGQLAGHCNNKGMLGMTPKEVKRRIKRLGKRWALVHVGQVEHNGIGSFLQPPPSPPSSRRR